MVRGSVVPVIDQLTGVNRIVWGADKISLPVDVQRLQY